MKCPRFSLSALMIIVALSGAEIALLRAIVSDAPSGHLGEAFAIASPMLTALAYALYALSRRRTGAPFWSGFLAVGCVMTMVTSAARWSESRIMEYYEQFVMTPVFNVVERAIVRGPFPPASGWESDNLVFWCAYMPLLLFFYSLPSAVPAVVAGWLSTRYRITITRRFPMRPLPEGDETTPAPHAAPDRTTRGALIP